MPVEPMYIPGRSRTGSSPSRTVMSFPVYAVSVTALLEEKMPAKQGFCGPREVYQTTAAGAGRGEARGGGPAHGVAELRIVDLRRSARPPRLVLRRGRREGAADGALLGRGGGDRAGREPERRRGGVADRGAQLARGSPPPCGRARTPRSRTRSSRGASRRARRAAATPRGRSRARPRRARPGSPPRAPRRPARPRRGARGEPCRRAAPSAGPHLLRGSPTSSCAGASGSASAPVAVTSVWPTRPEPVAEQRAGARRRAPRGRRRAGGAAGRRPGEASTSASARRSDSTAMRCSPCEPNVRRSRSPDEDPDLVEVRAEPRRAALQVARRGARRGRSATAARRRSRATRARGRARPRARRTAGPRSASTRARASTSCAASVTTWPVQGSSADASETPAATRRSAALRCPSAAA